MLLVLFYKRQNEHNVKMVVVIVVKAQNNNMCKNILRGFRQQFFLSLCIKDKRIINVINIIKVEIM